MRFQVPQFIEIEDKIFGPLSFKQFVYVVGGGGLVVLLFFLLPNFLAFLLAVPVAVFSGALAFYKVNNRPFIIITEAAIKHFLKKKLYIWKKEEDKGYFSESSLASEEKELTPSLSDKTFMLGMGGDGTGDIQGKEEKEDPLKENGDQDNK
ncbi:MAG: PrgI family mobile element protein [Patescibacteria group bacterium]